MHAYRKPMWIAAALVPLIAGTALASSPAMFVCRGDAIARVTCCCPQSQHRPPAPLSAPTLSAACCCDISRLDVPAIPAEVDSAALALANHHHEVIGPAPGDASVSPPSSLDTWPAVLLAQPPPHAVPILLGKQSRLI